MQIIVPKTRFDLSYPELPLFFLAGPVRGGGDWQQQMCLALQRQINNCAIAVPCSWDNAHPLARYLAKTREPFQRQLNWERYFLEMAGASQRSGAIIFWLGRQKTEITPEHPYAMDTRGEIGEWRGRMIHNRKLRVVVGGEEGFPGFMTIRRNFNLALGSDFPFFSTMDETAQEAVRIAARV